MARRETAAGAASGRCARSYLPCRFRRGSGTDGLPGFPGNRDRVSRRPCGKRRHAARVCGRLSRDPSLPRGAHRLPICDACFFLAPGDLAIVQRAAEAVPVRFPTGHYHGITVTIDPARAPDCLSCFLEDVEVRPSALIEKFCADGAWRGAHFL